MISPLRWLRSRIDIHFIPIATFLRVPTMSNVHRYTMPAAVCLMALSLPYPATAADTITTGTILEISSTSYAGSGTAVPFFIYLSANDTNIGCNSANLNAFAVDSTTDAGRAMIAIAISARLTGQQVTVYGTGSCTVWGLTDTVHSIVL